MHYYKRNLGDYYKKAGRLTILQHGVYNLLLDACYDREKFPTREEAIDWVWASTEEEIAAVDLCLKRFFTLNDDGTYSQTRIKEELLEYHKFCERQANNGRKGGRPKRAEKNPVGFENNPVETQQDASGSENKPKKSLTTNHKPLTNKNIKTSFDFSGWPELPDDQILSDWFAMRKRIKADVSQTVINNFGAELRRAWALGYTPDDCLSEAVTRNWRGFKVEWLTNAKNQQPTGQRPESPSERSARIAREMLARESDCDMDEFEEPWAGTRGAGFSESVRVDARILPLKRGGTGSGS